MIHDEIDQSGCSAFPGFHECFKKQKNPKIFFRILSGNERQKSALLTKKLGTEWG